MYVPRKARQAREWHGCQALATFIVLAGAVFAGRATAQTIQSGPERDSPQALAAEVAAGTWDRFTARVRVRREWVSAEAAVGGAAPVRADGGSVPAAQTSEYVLERRKTTSGWKTLVTVVSDTQPTVQTRSGPAALTPALAIARIEDDEDGSAPRFFDSRGTEVLPASSSLFRRLAAGAASSANRRPPGGSPVAEIAGPASLDVALVEQAMSMTAPRQAEGREWVRSLVLTPNRAASRRQVVQRALGRRAGWVRGYGRYMRQAGDRQVEVLLDERDGVPVETNVVEGGQLRSHTTYRYERAASGALVRRGARVERAVPPTPDRQASAASRVVTDISFSQVRLDRAGLDQTTGGR